VSNAHGDSCFSSICTSLYLQVIETYLTDFAVGEQQNKIPQEA
jgi:hypothetical protein